MRMPLIPNLTLAALALSLGVAGGCARSTSCPNAGNSAEQDGLVATITCCRQDAQAIHLRLTVRNATDRDVTLGAEGGAGAVALAVGTQQHAGTVYLERSGFHGDGLATTELLRIPGMLRINSHAAEQLHVDIPLGGTVDHSQPWHLRVDGVWSVGKPVIVSVPVEPPAPRS